MANRDLIRGKSKHAPDDKFRGRRATRCFTPPAAWDKLSGMNTITAILEADADGTLHLPVPQYLRRGKVKVVATLQAEQEASAPDGDAGTKTPLEALKELRKLGGLRHVIPDPVAWQREQRKERPLPGRD